MDHFPIMIPINSIHYQALTIGIAIDINDRVASSHLVNLVLPLCSDEIEGGLKAILADT